MDVATTISVGVLHIVFYFQSAALRLAPKRKKWRSETSLERIDTRLCTVEALIMPKPIHHRWFWASTGAWNFDLDGCVEDSWREMGRGGARAGGARTPLQIIPQTRTYQDINCVILGCLFLWFPTLACPEVWIKCGANTSLCHGYKAEKWNHSISTSCLVPAPDFFFFTFFFFSTEGMMRWTFACLIIRLLLLRAPLLLLLTILLLTIPTIFTIIVSNWCFATYTHYQ